MYYTEKEKKDAIALGICNKLNPEADFLKVHLSRKNLKQLSKSEKFNTYLGAKLDKRLERNFTRFCDSRTVHFKMFKEAFGEECSEKYKEFMSKIYKSNGKKMDTKCGFFENEEELSLSYVYLYNLYGEIRKIVNITAFEIKKEIDSRMKIKVDRGFYILKEE